MISGSFLMFSKLETGMRELETRARSLHRRNMLDWLARWHDYRYRRNIFLNMVEVKSFSTIGTPSRHHRGTVTYLGWICIEQLPFPFPFPPTPDPDPDP